MLSRSLFSLRSASLGLSNRLFSVENDAIDPFDSFPEAMSDEQLESGNLPASDLRMLDWCTRNGLSAPKLTVSYRNKRRGVFAVAPLKRGEFVACLPTKLAFSRLSCRSPAALTLTSALYKEKTLIDSPWADDIQYLELAILALFELCDPNSFWRPWLDSLPRAVGNGATLPLLEVIHQLGPDHPRLADAQQRVRRYQRFLSSTLANRHPMIRKVIDEVAKRRCGGDRDKARALFMWAVSIVDSRSFRGRLVATTPSSPSPSPSSSSTTTTSSSSSSPNEEDEGAEEGELIPVERIGVDARTQFMAPFFDLLNHGGSEGGFSSDVAQNVSMYFFPPPVPPYVASERLAMRFIHSLQQAGVDLEHFGLTSSSPFPSSSSSSSSSSLLSPLNSFRMLRAERDIDAGEELLIDYTATHSGATTAFATSSSSSSSSTLTSSSSLSPSPSSNNANVLTDAQADHDAAAMLFGFGFVPSRAQHRRSSSDENDELGGMGGGLLPRKYLKAAAALSVSANGPSSKPAKKKQASATTASPSSSSSISFKVETEEVSAEHEESSAAASASASIFGKHIPLRVSVQQPSNLNRPGKKREGGAQSKALRDRVEAAALMGSNLRYTAARDKRQAEIVAAMKKLRKQK